MSEIPSREDLNIAARNHVAHGVQVAAEMIGRPCRIKHLKKTGKIVAAWVDLRSELRLRVSLDDNRHESWFVLAELEIGMGALGRKASPGAVPAGGNGDTVEDNSEAVSGDSDLNPAGVDAAPSPFPQAKTKKT